MSLSPCFVDLHIHVGVDWFGKPVKITGSKSLTVTNILKEASRRKGLDVVGIIDAHSPGVQEELQYLVKEGGAHELDNGGIQFEETVLILGSEVEIYDSASSGPIHVLCYFPYLSDMMEFSEWLSKKMTNINLSSQRFYGTGRELQSYVNEHGGLFIPAHVFTPFKSLYGRGVKKSLTEVFDSDKIDAIELGLSSDTSMADQIKELHSYTYMTNSDAHSLGKLAREYQEMLLEEKSFLDIQKAIKGQEGRKILQNFGMNPKLGKYHQTVCAKCLHASHISSSKCNKCGSGKIVKGVYDRIQELSSREALDSMRPAYIYQVPLDYLPGLGKKTYEKLLDNLGTEMNVIHYATAGELKAVVPETIASAILDLRQGSLDVVAGGGGVYGKVHTNKD